MENNKEEDLSFFLEREFLKILSKKNIVLPQKTLEEMIKKDSSIIEEFMLFKKHRTSLVLSVKRQQYFSFEEIEERYYPTYSFIKEGLSLSYSFSEEIKNNKENKKLFLAPTTEKEVEIFLLRENYLGPPPEMREGESIFSPRLRWPRVDIYSKGFAQCLAQQGLEMIEEAHPSLVLEVSKKLTDKKLEEAGVYARGCHIVLLTQNEEYRFFSGSNTRSLFLGIRKKDSVGYGKKEFKLYYNSFPGRNTIFLVQKKKFNPFNPQLSFVF